MKASIHLPNRPALKEEEHVCLPWLWPVCALHMAGTDPNCPAGQHFIKHGLTRFSDILKFAELAHKLDYKLRPVWATANKIKANLKTMRLRNFSRHGAKNIPLLVAAPYAGHPATIADYSTDQSLVNTLQQNGIGRVYVTDWKPATSSMKNYGIDHHLRDIDAAVDMLGGRVHLVGLCQGGWMSAAYAARFPGKVVTLVLAGAPIDTGVGDGAIRKLTDSLPMKFYQNLVAAGGGRLLGQFMLAGWKSMHPTRQYVEKYVDLFAHLDDIAYLKRAEEFARWYETPVDLPGAYYLQAVEWIFKNNRLAKGTFVALNQPISLTDIQIPVYLLAGSEDDITPPVQVFNAVKYLGTPKKNLAKKLVPGGHIGLFMGRQTLQKAWPDIARWILMHDGNKRGEA